MSRAKFWLVSCHEIRLRPVRHRCRFGRSPRRAEPRWRAQSGDRRGIPIGGTCVIRGCIPKKLLVYGADYRQLLADAAGYGWTGGKARFYWTTLRDRVQPRSPGFRASIRPTSQGRCHGLRRARRGRRRAFGETGEVRQRVRAKRILIATGGRPYLPEGLPGLELGISSNEAFLPSAAARPDRRRRIHRAGIREISAGWVRDLASCIAATRCCADSTTTCARTCTSRPNARRPADHESDAHALEKTATAIARHSRPEKRSTATS